MKKIIPFLMVIFIFSVLAISVQPVLAGDASTTSFKDGLEKTNIEAKLDTTGTVESKIGKIAGIIFGFVSIVFLIMIVYGGIIWMTASGTEANVKKARATLVHAAIGLFVTMISYQVASYVITKIAETTS